MKYLGEVLAFGFLFLFIVFFMPTLIEKTSVIAGFGSEGVIISYLPWIFLGSMIGLVALIVVERRIE